MTHTIDISDKLWEHFQRLTGIDTPATPMREVLWDYVTRQNSLSGQSVNAMKARQARQSPGDVGSPFVLRDETRCSLCGGYMPAGSRGLIRTHPDNPD